MLETKLKKENEKQNAFVSIWRNLIDANNKVDQKYDKSLLVTIVTMWQGVLERCYLADVFLLYQWFLLWRTA